MTPTANLDSDQILTLLQDPTDLFPSPFAPDTAEHRSYLARAEYVARGALWLDWVDTAAHLDGLAALLPADSDVALAIEATIQHLATAIVFPTASH